MTWQCKVGLHLCNLGITLERTISISIITEKEPSTTKHKISYDQNVISQVFSLLDYIVNPLGAPPKVKSFFLNFSSNMVSEHHITRGSGLNVTFWQIQNCLLPPSPFNDFPKKIMFLLEAFPLAQKPKSGNIKVFNLLGIHH